MLKAQIKDLQQQLDRVTKELQESRELNETILMINEEFRRENDDLYKKLEQYRAGSSSDENGSDDTHATNVTESNKKSARVCIYIFFF